ncbi:DUF6508 domain-containing protein [Nocardia sp. NPDC052316]|uniref:DUF6508 domain-containing protein n=1 Tax=Nocardia sp. NPDC052316 TaxID=3364329 RepID=UPI0037C78980
MAGWLRRLFRKTADEVYPGYTAAETASITAQFAEFNRERERAEAELRANPYHPDPSDNPAIESVLRAAPREAWHQLWSAVDDIRAEDPQALGSWRTNNRDGSLCMPHVQYSEAVDRMTQAVYAVGAIVGFDWMKWDRKTAYPGGRGLETAPVADAARVLTAVIRGERFGDGIILTALNDGTLPAALQRLRTWYEQQEMA